MSTNAPLVRPTARPAIRNNKRSIFRGLRLPQPGLVASQACPRGQRLFLQLSSSKAALKADPKFPSWAQAPACSSIRGASIALPEIYSDAPQPSIAGISLEGLSDDDRLRTPGHRLADCETSASVAAVPPQHPVLAVLSAGAVAIPAGETVTELFARLLVSSTSQYCCIPVDLRQASRLPRLILLGVQWPL